MQNFDSYQENKSIDKTELENSSVDYSIILIDNELDQDEESKEILEKEDKAMQGGNEIIDNDDKIDSLDTILNKTATCNSLSKHEIAMNQRLLQSQQSQRA